MIDLYSSQTFRVRWNGELSELVKISNGVKQGAVLSAKLFCIYIDDIIKNLRKSVDGCWINGNFVGAIVYADDIVLLSPSIDGLQNMIKTCDKNAKELNLTFGTDIILIKSKTKCLAFVKKKKELRCMLLNDKILPWVHSVRHLGTTITTDLGCKTNQDLAESERHIYRETMS